MRLEHRPVPCIRSAPAYAILPFLISLVCSAARAQPVPSLVAPVVSILAPRDGAEVSQTNVTLQLRITAPSERPLALRILVDGLEVVRTRDLILTARDQRKSPAPVAAEVEEGIQRVDVPIPRRDCVLRVIAESENRASAAQEVHLRWTEPPAQAATFPAHGAARKPKLYLLAVGISNYQSAELRLQYPAKDARDFAAALDRQQGPLYQSVQSRVLTDEQATKGNILDGLEWLQRQATQHDLVMLFLAGHGINDPGTGSYAFLPYDADLSAVKRTLVSDADIRSTLVSLAGKALLFMDTCHAGNVMGSVRLRAIPNYAALMSELSSADNGVIVFASSTGRQSSRESERWNNGAFTKALVEGLRGHADFARSGRITVSMLDLYISERVKELTSGLQTPSTAKPSTLPDYPIAVVLPGDEPPLPDAPSKPSLSPAATLSPPSIAQPPPNSPQKKEARPLHKRWWFWTAMLGGTAIAATALGVGLTLSARDPSPPADVSVFDRSF